MVRSAAGQLGRRQVQASLAVVVGVVLLQAENLQE